MKTICDPLSGVAGAVPRFKFKVAADGQAGTGGADSAVGLARLEKRLLALRGDLDAVLKDVRGLRGMAPAADAGPVALNKVDLVRLIQQRVAMEFDQPLRCMTSQSRLAEESWPRQLAMCLARELTGMKLCQIGRMFGGRDHGTVMYAMRRVRAACDVEPHTRELVDRLWEELQPRKGGVGSFKFEVHESRSQ